MTVPKSNSPYNKDGCVAMQSTGRIVKTQQELKEAVFPNAAQHLFDYSCLCQRAILAPRNEDVSVMIKQLLQEFPGSVQLYKSIDIHAISTRLFTIQQSF
ncbi:hypothetical protein AVEN_76533-1 [Araneus ventricosus]|uniref:Uncharacterized protein n=1 Tax=Araneus ventricosus TaxID=182803 RepID=A0A4Y2CF57_ARAVE|nr:hypothetical protein AVEN_76533-1 [Araneus ventricosus]